MKPEIHLVLIGDLIRSRESADRAKLQQRLAQCLATLNDAGSPELVSPYTITLGDEFQAVRTGVSSLWPELLRIQAAVLPTRVRFALGVGEIATPINTEQALGMDGQAFYEAREGLDRLKPEDRTLAINGLNSGDQRWANALVQVIDSMTRKWRANRFEILYRLMMQQSPADIAAELDLSVQAVYRNIRDGDLELVMELFALLDTLIESCFDRRSY